MNISVANTITLTINGTSVDLTKEEARELLNQLRSALEVPVNRPVIPLPPSMPWPMLDPAHEPRPWRRDPNRVSDRYRGPFGPIVCRQRWVPSAI